MILYLDTSSLLKLYLEEEHSDLVRSWAGRAEVLFTVRVAYPEMMSALARRWRAGDLDESELRALQQAVSADWDQLGIVDINETAAAELAIRLGLRGYDAIHLAAAIEVVAGSESVPAFFSSFDHQLNQAARTEGLAVLDAETDLDPTAAGFGGSLEVHEPQAEYHARPSGASSRYTG